MVLAAGIVPPAGAGPTAAVDMTDTDVTNTLVVARTMGCAAGERARRDERREASSDREEQRQTTAMGQRHRDPPSGCGIGQSVLRQPSQFLAAP